MFLIARPPIDWAEVERYLTDVHGEAWLERVRGDAAPDGERLVEFMGRMCYRSWAPGLNPNVTKVRHDPPSTSANPAQRARQRARARDLLVRLCQVSRVFTHELVRHRAGAAISQESLRYVRLADIPFEHPDFVRADPELLARANELIASMESFQELVVDRTGIAGDGVDFHTKKTVTSAARRYAPDGVATTIGWSVNIRALRHVIAMRTDPGAEEEIRRVFDAVATLMQKELPALLGDFVRRDDGSWTPEFSKV